jgi:hypothetical protein
VLHRSLPERLSATGAIRIPDAVAIPGRAEPSARRSIRSDPVMHLPIAARRTGFRRLSSAGLAGLVLFLLVTPALAHEERDVGDYSFEVGLINEPVYVGQSSGLEFHVTKAGQPVSGLATALKAEVIYGPAKRDLPLVERESDPGWYQSVFIPTAAGKYTFHILGTVEGSSVDESFTSSPDGFNEVQEAASGQFPATLPTAAELSAEAKKGADAANQVTIALVLGGAGLIVGLLGLGVALASRRRAQG